MTTKRLQPEWKPPANPSASSLPQIKIYNSLTSQKESFVPLDGKTVKWYSCGPTVYDSSHMGHARNYISFDILRRILKNYFKYDVTYAMNITDIDDKIVKRARQKFLINQYKEALPEKEQLITDVKEALKLLKTKSETEPEPEKKDYMISQHEKISTLMNGPNLGSMDPKDLFASTQDILSDYLDKLKGSKISDLKIFKDLASVYEEEFHADMRSLNILDADRIVRVSEYVENIIKFIERIISNGYAYASKSGSVYFDTLKFDQDPTHFYAKLVPTAFGDAQKLSTGEGDLSEASEKVNACDFALWKASKPGEPFWPSPWGEGRPGWHIECSAMASDIFGPSMDIHSGGVDLKFPHHDNELAQSEAYHKNDSWVSYFLHSGHLTISGCKMSKSLKNFITIREALRRNSARQLRIVFLKHSWREVLDYSPDTMTEAINFEKSLYDFLFNSSYLIRLSIDQSTADKSPSNVPNETDKAYAVYLELNKKLRTSIHTGLCDNFDTHSVIISILQYISDMNNELSKNPVDSKSDQMYQTACAFSTGAKLIIQTMEMFGAAYSSSFSQPGITTDSPDVDVVQPKGPMPWVSLDVLSQDLFEETFEGVHKCSKEFTEFLINTKDQKVETIVNDYKKKMEDVKTKKPSKTENVESDLWPLLHESMTLIAEYRQKIRSLAQGSEIADKSVKMALLKTCDFLRDDLLPMYNVRLQDKSLKGSNEADTPAVGYLPKWILLEMKKEKENADSKKKEEKLAKEKQQNESAKINPKEMFLAETDKYSKFDEAGLPTHDAEGNELTKSKLKKLVKLQETQAKKYATWLQKNEP